MEKKFCRGRDTKVLFSQDTEGCVQDSVSTVLWIWGWEMLHGAAGRISGDGGAQ